MPIARTTLASRFSARRAAPRLVALHRALNRLKSTVTVLHTGAHPDDEQNGMLALMRFGIGMRTIIGCSTRGEGGQNSLGPERGGALGILRTRELEQAARTIDADIVWLGFGPDDPVHDFGFSKNGEDTLRRWGREIIVERLVRAYRSEKPDIVIPTFLDVSGQHGHHRAMTLAAEEAIGLAADPNAFPEHLAEGLSPWTVTKFYLPAWSGGGSTYDDEVPPPVETVRLVAHGADMPTGVSFAEIGEWSRIDHASQGMGDWSKIGQTEWPLHLKIGPRTETDIRDNLPNCLADIDSTLRDADLAIGDAIAAFPHVEAVLPALIRAAEAIDRISVPEVHRHRTDQMLKDIEHAIAVTAGIDCIAAVDRPLLAQGQSCDLDVTLHGAANAEIFLILPDGLTAHEISAGAYRLTAASDAPLSDPFTRIYSAGGASGSLRVSVKVEIAGRSITQVYGLETPIVVVPAVTVALEPTTHVVQADTAFENLAVRCALDGIDATVSLAPVEGVTAETTPDGLLLSSPGLAEGRYRLMADVGGKGGFAATPISYPHIGNAVHITGARVDLLALEIKLPADRRVAYVGGGADNTALWLRRMGFEVIELDAKGLSQDLSRFPAIVIGIFAFGLRPDLAEKAEALRLYVEAGGNLVTLYHRPWDGWTPETTPPRFLKIGQPSLRWRVTDPDADVDILVPDHPLLEGVNVISKRDFAGWNKERGLYFAAEWDDAYVPLLAMNDAGEAPLKGALLSAEVGMGRHTHTSLVLHHQLDSLVPGAFRLIANLVAGGRM